MEIYVLPQLKSLSMHYQQAAERVLEKKTLSLHISFYKKLFFPLDTKE